MRFTTRQQDGEEPRFSICESVYLRVAPLARRPTACLCSPFSARGRAMRFDVRGVDHLGVGRSSVPSKFPEQVFPDATPRPAHKAIIDRCRRTILGRAIAPATAALQYMYDAADDPAIVRPLDTPYIRWQMRFYPLPLLIAEPKQVPAHGPDPQENESRHMESGLSWLGSRINEF